MICCLESTQVIMNPEAVGKRKRIWYLTVIINPGMPPLSKIIFQFCILFMRNEKMVCMEST